SLDDNTVAALDDYMRARRDHACGPALALARQERVPRRSCHRPSAPGSWEARWHSRPPPPWAWPLDCQTGALIRCVSFASRMAREIGLIVLSLSLVSPRTRQHPSGIEHLAKLQHRVPVARRDGAAQGQLPERRCERTATLPIWVPGVD